MASERSEKFQVEIEPDEQDIVKRQNIFFYKSVYCDVEKEEDGTMYITLPEHTQATFKVRQGKETIDDCFARKRCIDGDRIIVRETLEGCSDFEFGRYERTQFPQGKLILSLERTKGEIEKMYVDACKDHLFLVPKYVSKEEQE